MLLGPSGCGKSTLLMAIAGLLEPDSGEIRVDGAKVAEPGPDRALVFQDGALFPWLTVRSNVGFGLREARVPSVELRERVDRALAQVGLSGWSDRAVHELSGGMRQRVAIARALVLRPRVLLMDEPFSALDSVTRHGLYDVLQDLQAELNTTILFVTHNVREAVTLGDRVFVMAPRPGRFVAQETVEILRPRHPDDEDVARTAARLAAVMDREGLA